MTSTYYNKAQGIILIYDCTDKNTFNNISNWIDQITNHTNPDDIVILLVSNKIDLLDEREVTEEMGMQLAEDHELKYFEASAKTGINVDVIY